MFDIIKALFGAVKSSPFKLVLVLAIIASVTGFIVWYDHARFEAGYNSAQVELHEAHQEAMRAAVEKAKKDLNEALALEKEGRIRAERDYQRLREKPPEVEIREVIKIVESSECKRVGSDVIGLLNGTFGSKPDSQ